MKGRTVAAVVALTLVTAGLGASAVGAAQSDGPELYFSGIGTEEYHTNPGDSLAQEVILNGVDDGVGEFQYEFALSDPALAAIVDVKPGEGVSSFEATIGPNNDTVRINGTGAAIGDDGFVDGHVAMTLRGTATGRFEIVPEDVRVADASGSEYAVSTQDLMIEVTDRPILVASVRQGPGTAYDSAMSVDGQGEVTIVGEDVDTGVGSFAVNITQEGREGAADLRFVNATVRGEPIEQSITFGPNGTYVNVTASGLDTADTGVVPLVNLTVRGLAEGEAHLEYAGYAVTDEAGRQYVIDHYHIGGVEFSAASAEGPPTFTPPATETATAVDAGTATNGSASDDGGAPDAGTTAGTGPGLGTLTALAGIAVGALTLVARRSGRRR